MSFFTPFAFVKLAAVAPAPSPLPPVTSSLGFYLTTYDTDSWPGTGTTWYDLSPNGYNFTLTNPSESIESGVTWFYMGNDGATKRYAANTANFTSGMPAGLNDFNTNGTYFYVIKKNSNFTMGPYGAVGSINNGTGTNNDYTTFQRHGIEGTSAHAMYNAGSSIATSANFNNTGSHIIACRWNSGTNTWNITVDGGTGDTTGFGTPMNEGAVRRVVVGYNANLSDDPPNCNIAEVIWYNKYLDNTEFASVNDWLKTRYNIS